MLFPSVMSYFPTLLSIPDSIVSCSEKRGGCGTLISMCSKGKYSLDGKPPPSEIRPALLRYLAAPFNEDGFSTRQPLYSLSSLKDCSTILALLSSLNRSALNQHYAVILHGLWSAANVRSHLLAFGLPYPYNYIRTLLLVVRHVLNRTGFLNMSLLACAAMPPLILGALERRAATPLTLNLSTRVAIWVSIVARGSVAAGGAMAPW